MAGHRNCWLQQSDQLRCAVGLECEVAAHGDDQHVGREVHQLIEQCTNRAFAQVAAEGDACSRDPNAENLGKPAAQTPPELVVRRGQGVDTELSVVEWRGDHASRWNGFERGVIAMQMGGYRQLDVVGKRRQRDAPPEVACGVRVDQERLSGWASQLEARMPEQP
jgi:hypothetical protein